MLSQAYFRQGVALQYLGRHADALAAFASGLAQDPKSLQLLVGMVEAAMKSPMRGKRRLFGLGGGGEELECPRDTLLLDDRSPDFGTWAVPMGDYGIWSISSHPSGVNGFCFLLRVPRANVPAAAEDEAGQEPLRGGLRDWTGAADSWPSRCLCRGSGSGLENWHLQLETEGLRLLCPEQCLLVSGQCREKLGLHAAGLGRGQDLR